MSRGWENREANLFLWQVIESLCENFAIANKKKLLLFCKFKEKVMPFIQTSIQKKMLLCIIKLDFIGFIKYRQFKIM